MSREFTELADTDDIRTNFRVSERRSETPVPGLYTLAKVGDKTVSKYTFPYPKNGDPDQVHNHAGYNFVAEIIGGPSAGRYVKVGANTMSFRGDSSAIAQYLEAVGSSLKVTTRELIADCTVRDNGVSLIDPVGGPFQAITTWEWSCRTCRDKSFLKGYKNPAVPNKYAGPKPTIAMVDGHAAEEQICPSCEQPVTAQHIVSKYVLPRSTSGNGNGRSAGSGPVAG